MELKSTSNSGQDGTLGGGSTSEGEHGAWVPLGTKLTSGKIYVEFDVHVPPGGRQSGPQWWLRDGDAAVNLSVALDWIDNANGGIDPQSNFHDTTAQPANLFWDTDITAATENIHFTYVVDLDNKHVTYTATSIEEPLSTINSGPHPFDKTYEPDQVYLYLSAIAGGKQWGYDNICFATGGGECSSFVVPDPGTDFEWNTASGDWGTAANWVPLEGTSAGAPPGNQAAEQSSWHTAIFGDAIGSESRIVFTENSVTVNSISFNNTMGGSYTISGRPSVNVNASTVGTAASVRVAAGSQEFQVPFGILSNTTANIASGATLTFNNALNLNGQTLTKSGAGTMTVNNVLTTGEVRLFIRRGLFPVSARSGAT